MKYSAILSYKITNEQDNKIHTQNVSFENIDDFYIYKDDNFKPLVKILNTYLPKCWYINGEISYNELYDELYYKMKFKTNIKTKININENFIKVKLD